MSYQAHSRLTDPAKPRSEPWRLGLGLVAGALVWMGLSSAIFAVIALVGGDGGLMAFSEAVSDPSSPGGTLFQLGNIGLIALAVAIVVTHMHKRDVATVIGPLPEAVSQFGRVLGAIGMLYLALALLPPWEGGAALTQNLPVGLWLGLLPLSLTAVLFQTGAEEMLFRGYIQQQLAARFRSPVAWMVLPSVVFALGHFAPGTFPGNAALVAAWAGLFGLAAADLTARSGTLGPAIALHFATNSFSLLLTALPGGLSGLALYTVTVDPADTAELRALLPIDLLVLFNAWLAARIALRR